MPKRSPPSLKRSSSLSDAEASVLLPQIDAAAAAARGITPAASSDAVAANVVAEYLRAHPAFLERYATSAHVLRDTFQRWTLRRIANGNDVGAGGGAVATRLKSKARRQLSNTSYTSADDCAGVRRAFAPQHTFNACEALYELATACAQLAHIGNKFELRVVDDAHSTAASSLPAAASSDASSPSATRWLSVTRVDGVLSVKTARRYGKKLPAHVLKLVDCTDALIGEIHFLSSVGEKDSQIFNILAAWACSALYYAKLVAREPREDGGGGDALAISAHDGHSGSGAARFGALSPLEEDGMVLRRQRKLNAFLLDVVKSIFQDMITMDTVILKVMNFAQKLVDADRASLFLVDATSRELYARIFDISQETESAGDPEKNIQINNEGHKEIRFKIGKGIAGYVAQTGRSLNIADAYEDARFNREIDTKTGYRTKTILCMPIFLRNNVIGVVQMVNKHLGTFTRDDEDAFETFAIYCGLALHHARLYDKIRRSEQKYRVALEVLAYHSVCTRDEVDRLKKAQQRLGLKDTGEQPDVPRLDIFEFNTNTLTELEKPLFAVHMFNTLFRNVYDYENDDLIRFVLTVRKNYRQVPYHNWTHGWTVAQAMFVFLRRQAAEIFTPLESLALFVAALCHDLDHRGKNNAYMKSMSTPLASIYSTSVMEHHHFNQTVTILQQEGHNIFKSLRSDEYKEAFSIIRRSILATDLALFFPNRAQLSKIVADGTFDWNNDKHRSVTQAILMTACDLIATAKPWKIQIETVKVIFEEFYEQGDAEKLNGREPLPMMDRTRAGELPQMQVGFMQNICIPCYEALSAVLPDARILRDRTRSNSEKWAELAEENAAK